MKFAMDILKYFLSKLSNKFYFLGCSLPARRGRPRDHGGHGQGKRKDDKQLICPILHCKKRLAISDRNVVFFKNNFHIEVFLGGGGGGG
jgi:hypothetical protein